MNGGYVEIIVCIRRVPDLSEAEIEIGRDGVSLDDDDLDYDVNEWDNFAIEAAVQLKEEHGGRVTAMTVGDEESEDVLRRALAMGADEAVHLMDDAFDGSDALGTATILGAGFQIRLSSRFSLEWEIVGTFTNFLEVFDNPDVEDPYEDWRVKTSHMGIRNGIGLMIWF